MKKKLETEYASLPNGTLKIFNSNGHQYLRCRIGSKERYLSMKRYADIKVARMLRRKRYLKEVIDILSNNIVVLAKLIKAYKKLDHKSIIDGLSKAYQIPPGEEREVLPDFYPQKAEEMNVRSKSEAMIALILELEGLDVQYEREIVLQGRRFKPDFTIRHPETNELIYFEHFGLIDDPGYYRNMIEKLIIYWNSGIRLGENLIVTFETKEHPLTPAVVRGELKRFFELD